MGHCFRFTVIVSLAVFLSGCNTAGHSVSSPVIAPLSGLHGFLNGGQQPIVGATLQMYEAGTTGDGSAGSPMLAPALISDADGGFDLTGKFTCTTPTSLVYIVATGGNPGVAPPFSNAASTLISALGPCGNPTGITFININEVTTVAAVYALTPFMSSPTSIGSGPGDPTLLADAFALAWEYANPSSGYSPGINVPPGTTIPVAQINTLANLLSACVNSRGGAAGDSSVCGQLFLLTTPAATTAATDTATALLYVARNPNLNTPDLYALVLPTAPFQPSLTAQPPDFGVRATVPSNFTVTPASLDFASIFLGGTTSSQPLTITNTTTHALAITSFEMAGSNPGDFAYSYPVPDGCGTSYTIQPGTACRILFTFNPRVAGTRQAYFVVHSTSANPFIPVFLSGVGTVGAAGPVTVSPASLNFSLYNTPQPVTLTNGGNTPLSIGGITFNTTPEDYFLGPYTETDDCGTTLPPQSSCIIQVSLHPHTAPRVLMKIADDTSTGSQTVTLTARVLSSASAPDSIDLGQQSIATQGTLPFEIDFASGQLNMTLTGTNAADFSFSPSGAQSILSCTPQPPFGSCLPTLYFNPSALGLRTAAITIPGIGNILLHGTGVGPGPYFALTPDSPSLINVRTGAFSISSQLGSSSSVGFPMRYTGTIPNTTINAPVVSGPHASEFTATTECQDGYLEPSGICLLTLTYTPTTVASFTGSMLISDSTNTVQQTIPFHATSSGPATTVSADQLTFGDTPAGTLSAPQSVTAAALTNNPVNATVSGPFQITQGAACTATPCQISVVFAPPANTSPGTSSGSLNITDPLTGNNAIVSLSGTAQ